MEYIIEKNIPIPSPHKNRGKHRTEKSVLPGLEKLEVGDSFLADQPPRALTYIYHWMNVRGKKVITRGEAGGTRIWRIK